MQLRPAHQDQDSAFVQGLYDAFYPSLIPAMPNLFSTYRVRIAEADDGTAVGVQTLSPGNFLWISVLESHRRQGIGTLLLNDALEAAAGAAAQELISRVDDADAAGVAFCARYAFEPYLHMLNLELDLTRWDDAALVAARAATTVRGITLRTYADFGDTDASRQRLYTLNKALNATIPRDHRQPFIAFDAYVEQRLMPPAYKHEGIQLAVLNDQWIGMSQVSLHDGYAFNEMTGVLPEYRGQGIAQTLKRLSVQFAYRSGRTVLRTFNDLSNAPMIAVNEKVGFERRNRFYQVRRKLT